MSAVVPDTCYAEGQVLTVGAQQIPVPAPSESVSISWMNDDTVADNGGNAWVTRQPDGLLEMGYTLDQSPSQPAVVSGATGTMAATAVGNECSDSAYWYWGAKNRGWTYRVNPNNRPSGVTASDWTTEINLAASTWDVGTNACGYRIGSSLWSVAISRGTDTSARAASSTGAGCVFDGVNVIDFGPLPSPRIGQTCRKSTWLNGWKVGEADVRAKQSAIWFKYLPSSCSGKYELAGLLTHEMGHVLGFNDLDESDHRYLTMSGTLTACTYQDRILGRGDYLGLAYVYGV